jgi:hypothetical protein
MTAMGRAVIPEVDRIEEGGEIHTRYKTVVNFSGIGVPILLFVGVVCLIAGVMYLTQLTAGVGGIAAACFFAIVARIAQAHEHSKR